MRRKVISFFVLLFVFVLALAFLSFAQTGHLSSISGYAVAVEDESHDGSIYGTILSGMIIGLLFCYIVKFIFESYERRYKETEFKKHIDLDLS